MNPFAKYVFIVFNTFILLLGVLLVTFGCWLLYGAPVRELIVTLQWGPTISYGTIIVGSMVFLVGVFGLMAVIAGIHKSNKLVVVYCIISACVFLILLGIVSYGGAEKETFKSQFSAGWAELSNENKYLIQDRFNCCGLVNASEWNGAFDNSCLVNPPDVTLRWPVACLTPLLEWVDPNVYYLGAFAGIVLILQMSILITLVVSLIQDRIKSKVDIDEETELQKEDNF